MPRALSVSKTKGEFSVWWWDPQDHYYPELRSCGMEEAIKMAKSLSNRPAAKLGAIKRIIITDGGDRTCFEWRYGAGVIFPPLEDFPKPEEP